MDEFENNKYKININDIKSSFIIKIIFSLLSEKQKLNMIMYNKELQMKVSININDYKKISGKYKIGGKNGKVKEYIIDTNILIYKGEYLNGKRNGKGKEYNNNGELIFKGEYLNGERNGKGKEYNNNGELIFKGKYLNGERNGKGEEYNNGELKFEGVYFNGKKWNGKGYTFYGNIEYEIKNGNGIVKEYSKNTEFIGLYLDGERNGKGKEYINGK